MLTRKGDVIVVGGSLEGALIARSLHQSGQKVILLESQRPRDPDCPYERWVCSPFLYSPFHWQWCLDSQKDWQTDAALHFQDGVALAPRESVSWEKLQQVKESHQIKDQLLQTAIFPELKLTSGLGSIYLEKLAYLDISGLTEQIWTQLQREGADPCADTEVVHIDWEHEWPTAVTRDTVFRAHRLILTVPGLLHSQTHSIKQLWIQGQPQLEKQKVKARPALWIHYARAPVYLWPGPQTWGWTRLCEAQENEEQFLQGIPANWLSCKIDQRSTYQLKVDQPAAGYHPWRQDCLWLSRHGQAAWPWFPQFMKLMTDPQTDLTPWLENRSLQPA